MIKEEEIRKASMLYSFAEYNIEREDEDFIEGAEWAIRQMKKDAVDGIVAESAGANGWVNVMTGFVRSKDVGVMLGDKVKLIIIKEE